MQRPLYSISAGELGLDAESLDNRLETVFELAQQWDLILLLDEADVFLEQRGTDNLTRHQLVSVFLRRLEYFRGILIPTTNRVENFDIAVLSRIQWKMQYSEIDPESRMQHWDNNLKRANTHCGGVLNITKQELNGLARKPFNGREIKNTVFTASVLARESHTPFSYAHLQKVIDATEVFQRTFLKTERSEHMYN
ncbi:P-loop containing nucleoside triphosphate hydrolase protein [Xylona heveae TC161]|uniref:p-loop containing nucleoside triphosphate hydrolase protein n=1 Tax=Xylona heveae (strain CBS 132557 / TC161) TaxID=1328760 RepID=A0A165JVR6_XYLHT|nr:P-loop containing nucleoside triphosphate hydrolase protein [Xylona heveae TC161]KZF26691.1 P-loop containing nucleoside triphosphate hydrolase protein [Xylona heveae TC161]